MLRKRAKAAVPIVMDVNTKPGWWWHAVLVLLPLIIASWFTSDPIANAQNAFKLGFRDMVMGLHFIDQTHGLAVGNNGLMLKTSDEGKHWNRMDVKCIANYKCSKISIDKNWRMTNLERDVSFKAVFFVGEKGWIVGERSLILRTDDSGMTWHKQTSCIDGKSFLDVFFLDENKGFIVGEDGTILKTANGGLNWEFIDMKWTSLIPEDLLMLGTISINLYQVYFSGQTFGWIVGDAGTVLRTQNGGKTWILSRMGDFPTLFSVCFKNDREGWAVGALGSFLESQDGGKIWKKQKVGVTTDLYKIRIKGDYGIVVGDMATVIESDDGGIGWKKHPLNLPPPYPWFSDAWIFPSSEKVLVVGAGMILDMRISSKTIERFSQWQRSSIR